MPRVLAILLINVLPRLSQSEEVHITTSTAIDYARTIARDQGYDVSKKDLYSYDVMTHYGGKPIEDDYIAIDVRVGTHAANFLMINRHTGQAIDYNTCEIFDYPDSKSFQKKIIALSHSVPK